MLGPVPKNYDPAWLERQMKEIEKYYQQRSMIKDKVPADTEGVDGDRCYVTNGTIHKYMVKLHGKWVGQFLT